jgi:hypothetical protein
VYPTISPALFTTSATSGSGTLTLESARTPMMPPSPTTRQAADLKNSSGRAASYTCSYTVAARSLSSTRARRELS